MKWTEKEILYLNPVNRFNEVLDRQNINRNSLKLSKKKIEELKILSKFLLFFGEDIGITEIREEPDFLIKTNGSIVGLEVQKIINEKPKRTEGLWESVFERVNEQINQNKDLPNFLLNCSINKTFSFRSSEKGMIADQIYSIVKDYVERKLLPENPIIDKITEIPHSYKVAFPNFGAWWVRNLDISNLEHSIKKKEKKISTYIKNTCDQQWLLLVIGTNWESSYEMDLCIEKELKTKFNQVFILENFSTRLFQIK